MSKLEIALVVLMSSSLGICASQQRTAIPASADEQSVRKFLQTQVEDKETRYVAVFRDLNGDGVPEALAYLLGNEWCGSGGCTLFVLQKSGSSWKAIGTMTVTNPPIRALEKTCNHWHSLGVWVQGGGIQPGYEAELCFDGKTYPENPSVEPARRTSTKLRGRVLIGSIKKSKSVW
jgi:hypothetical protein